jgi:KUP system potassium uptake protein
MNTQQQENKTHLSVITLAAIGVVFGDIGTSPLYALKECFSPNHGIPFTEDAVMGVISMIFWAITLVVTFKYMQFILRADNKGEGGVLALMALALRTATHGSRWAKCLMMLGVFGACMFYGDVVLSPAISVISAIEGVGLAVPQLQHYVVPLAVIILTGIFLIQRYGTGVVGKFFGPVMLTWFVVLGLLGIYNIVLEPRILWALNPYYAYFFIHEHALQAFVVLGVVVLVLTGAEAVYADMGHFGLRPIRLAWLYVVMPCLILNYVGQGATLLANPEAVDNPFYRMVPEAVLYPMVILAMVSTIIASQAVISGAFSLTSQAILLGFVPRMQIKHTSANEQGQIYIPVVNWLLWALVIAVVVSFKKSENLAAAYGIAVTTTMVITTLLAAIVMRSVWKWHTALVALAMVIFLTIDVAFFSANLLKIPEGGWFPLLLGGLLFFLFMTWYAGRMLLRASAQDGGIPLVPFMESLLAHPPHRVEGTAVFLTGNMKTVPVALLHNLKHNRILHERVFFLKISIWDVPFVDDDKRIILTPIGDNIYQLRAVFGFKEVPDINRVLELTAQQFGMQFELMETSFFIARDTLVPRNLLGMSLWREYIFAWMYQNGAKPSDFFRLPTNRIVELGSKIEI